jgi:hypothetical protein
LAILISLVLSAQLKDRWSKSEEYFCSQLDFAAADSSVRAMFERHGTLDRVNRVTDRDTGRQRREPRW